MPTRGAGGAHSPPSATIKVGLPSETGVAPPYRRASLLDRNTLSNPVDTNA